VFHEDKWRIVYCFADPKHAEKFRKRFGGAGFNPKARGRGSSWARIYLEHFWNDFAADHNKSVSERDRQIYARAYAQPGGDAEVFPKFRVGRDGLRKLRQDQASDADAGAAGRAPKKSAPPKWGNKSALHQAVSGPTTNKSRSKQIRRMRQGQARRQLPIGPKMIVTQAAIPSQPAPLR
jgi:hypothetical protein